MLTPIKKYIMNTYEIDFRELTLKSDLEIELVDISFDNLKDVAALRKGARYKEYKRTLEENKSIGIAVKFGNEIIGYGWGKFEGAFDNFFHINVDGYIGGIFVDSKYRGHNVAPVIIYEIIKRLREKGVCKYYVAIQEQNYASIKAVEKIGMNMLDKRTIYRIMKRTVPKKNII